MRFPFREHPDQSPRRSAQAPHPAGEEVIPDDLVDALLDREVSPLHEDEVRRLIARDPDAQRRLDATDRILRALRREDRSVQCPDFTHAVLARVNAQKGLFSCVGLRRVAAYRYAAAAALLAAVGALYTVQRAAPDAVRLVPAPAPIAQVVDAVPTETADVVSGLRTILTSVQGMVPPARAPLPPAAPAAMAPSPLAEFIPVMNPPHAAYLWLDGPSAVPTRLPDEPTRALIFDARDFYASEPASFRSILFSPARPGRENDVALVRFGR